ncbi:MAG TPA: hypothetical protein VFP87_11150, partial [Chitinophagaceae bacterium]|nr:hypothetical protein [Chitinophagaceae bacterium]
MKTIMIMMVMMLTLTTSWAFTGEEPINKQALQAFRTEFAGANDAAWSIDHDYYRVTFTLNSQKLFAYYSMDGEFMAVTRYLSSTQLPLNLQSGLKKYYGDYWLTDLFELANTSGTSYHVTLEKANGKIILKSVN